LEYYERRYYNKLKDDYYNFKISDSIYCCPFCYNEDYSLTDLLRHASRIAGNSRKTVKDIAKHYALKMYIKRYKFDDERVTKEDNNRVIEENDSLRSRGIRFPGRDKEGLAPIFKPTTDSGPTFYHTSGRNINPATLSQQSLHGIEASIQSQRVDAVKVQFENKGNLHLKAKFNWKSKPMTRKGYQQKQLPSLNIQLPILAPHLLVTRETRRWCASVSQRRCKWFTT
jgi:hypothetical protein